MKNNFYGMMFHYDGESDFYDRDGNLVATNEDMRYSALPYLILE